jgi:hypothetical protein
MYNLLVIIYECHCRSENADDRPNFSTVVDILLDINDSLAETKHTEVMYMKVN